MASTRLRAAAYEMPNISATCATVSMSVMFFFFLISRITHGFWRKPCSQRSYVVLQNAVK